MVQEDYVCKDATTPNYAWLSVRPASNRMVLKIGTSEPQAYPIKVLAGSGGLFPNAFRQQEHGWTIAWITFDKYNFTWDWSYHGFRLIGGGVGVFDCMPDVDEHLEATNK
jgi:hypothetical protein